MSCVYQIKCKDPKITATYVGSTVDLKQRICQHRHRCIEGNKKSHYKLYVFIRENGGFDNFEFNVLQSYQDITKEDLIKEEEKYFKELTPELNINHPTRSYKEWYQEEKEKVLKQCKKYREKNKEKLSEQHKEWYQKNKDDHKAKCKTRYEKNKETILAQCKVYREEHREEKIKRDTEYRKKNRERINSQRREKYTCEICGKIVSRGTKARHERSQFHISKIKSNIQNCTNNEQ